MHQQLLVRSASGLTWVEARRSALIRNPVRNSSPSLTTTATVGHLDLSVRGWP